MDLADRDGALESTGGDVVTMRTWRGTEELEIIAIRYDELLSETQCAFVLSERSVRTAAMSNDAFSIVMQHASDLVK